MKKTIALLVVILCVLSVNIVFAADTTNELQEKNQNEVTEIKDKMELKKI